jgi:hypothetical protein
LSLSRSATVLSFHQTFKSSRRPFETDCENGGARQLSPGAVLGKPLDRWVHRKFLKPIRLQGIDSRIVPHVC